MTAAKKKAEAIGVGSSLGAVLGVGAGITLGSPAVGIALGVTWALAFGAGVWADRSPATTAATSS